MSEPAGVCPITWELAVLAAMDEHGWEDDREAEHEYAGWLYDTAEDALRAALLVLSAAQVVA